MKSLRTCFYNILRTIITQKKNNLKIGAGSEHPVFKRKYTNGQ